MVPGRSSSACPAGEGGGERRASRAGRGAASLIRMDSPIGLAPGAGPSAGPSSPSMRYTQVWLNPSVIRPFCRGYPRCLAVLAVAISDVALNDHVADAPRSAAGIRMQ